MKLSPQEQLSYARYRVSVRIFNHIERNLREMPEYEAEVHANHLKNREDMLDTDIVQELTYGFPLNGERHRVIALTFDDAGTLLRRARHHRQVGNIIGTKYKDEQMVKVPRPFLDHPGGIIVQANKDGDIVRIIDLAPVFAQLQ